MGFGGIRAARYLAEKGSICCWFDRNNHMFQPLLYQVATAGLEQESIAYPVRAMAREWKGTRFQLAEVTGIDFQTRTVLYDHRERHQLLRHRIGGEVFLRPQELVGGERLRNHILTSMQFTSRIPRDGLALMGWRDLKGAEFAGALIELVRLVLAKDYPELSVQAARVVMVEASDQLLAACRARERGESLPSFRYRDKGVMATYWPKCSCGVFWRQSPRFCSLGCLAPAAPLLPDRLP